MLVSILTILTFFIKVQSFHLPSSVPKATPVGPLKVGGGPQVLESPHILDKTLEVIPAAKKSIVRFVTSNPLKTREINALLEEGGLDLPFEVATLDIELPEIQDDPINICIEKCKLAAEYIRGPVLVEDTSLGFGAHNNLPGPYIKWYLEALGCDGLYNMVKPFPDKSATAICNVGFSAGPGHEVQVFSGTTHGTIVAPCRNDNGFGWDTIFQPAGFDRTFSMMTISEKNKISHRSLALRQLQEYVAKNHAEISEKLQG